jgi:hypothetical protein
MRRIRVVYGGGAALGQLRSFAARHITVRSFSSDGGAGARLAQAGCRLRMRTDDFGCSVGITSVPRVQRARPSAVAGCRAA